MNIIHPHTKNMLLVSEHSAFIAELEIYPKYQSILIGEVGYSRGMRIAYEDWPGFLEFVKEIDVELNALPKHPEKFPGYEATEMNDTDLNFGAALVLLREGSRVARSGWCCKEMFLFEIKMWTYTDGKQDNYPNLPFIAMKTAEHKVVPWLASQTDMLANDWMLVA